MDLIVVLVHLLSIRIDVHYNGHRSIQISSPLMLEGREILSLPLSVQPAPTRALPN